MKYYSEKLAGKRLKDCYELASPRVKQYLEAEIQHVLSMIRHHDIVLELGCGYGRVAFRIAQKAKQVIGIDTALESLALARSLLIENDSCVFQPMDATKMNFDNNTFDLVVCIQNGICAFNVDPLILVQEALRVTRVGGCAVFSSYANRFWPHRLKWFERQAKEGLLGEIDEDLTGDGVIVCKDGFRSGHMTETAFMNLGRKLGIKPRILEVDESSLFCELMKI